MQKRFVGGMICERAATCFLCVCVVCGVVRYSIVFGVLLNAMKRERDRRECVRSGFFQMVAHIVFGVLYMHNIVHDERIRVIMIFQLL